MSSSFKRSLALIVISLLLFGLVNGQGRPASKDLPNFFKVNANLYRGGQPTEAGFQQLKQMGIKAVIDLREDGKRAKTEASWARSAGIKFISIPLGNWFRPKDAIVATVLAAIDGSADQPVFVHCRRGSDRTGMIIAVYRISHDGWTAKQANAEAKAFGFGWWQVWMKDYIDDYFRDHKTTHRDKVN